MMNLIHESLTIPPPCCTLDISGAEQERLVQMFKALGNPIRFEIMKFLVTRPGCITGDIVEFLPIAQATVSQHLKVLREAGWISGVIESNPRFGPLALQTLDDFTQGKEVPQDIVIQDSAYDAGNAEQDLGKAY